MTGIDSGDSVSQSSSVTVDTVRPVVSSVSDAPDPFRPSQGQVATIQYTLSEAGNITVQVTTKAGKPIRTLVLNGAVLSGANSIVWDGRNDSGTMAAAATYTYTIAFTDQAGNKATAYPVKGTTTLKLR